ncbi:SpoIIE family protein phosphatase [Streptomyces albidochromogenes]|uniref:SpoIIE family protein phosphatase n=2 Tax=Streptomyces albidochromogenes TaxID=329524 RepID=UPI002FE92EE0
MTQPLTSPTTLVPSDHHRAVQLAAATSRAHALQAGLPGSVADQAAALASELAGHLAQHAKDGAHYIQPLPTGSGPEILAADHGPGTAPLQRCLADGPATPGPLGAGLGTACGIAAELMVRTQAHVATLICARFALSRQPRPAGQDAGLICLPADGETNCGDAGAIAEDHRMRTAIVIDGLGHGPSAAEAAQAALHAFHRQANRPLPDLLQALHQELRHTRGAAVALLRLHHDHADYCSVGNIRALALSPRGVDHHLTGQPGIVGWKIPTPRAHRIPLSPNTTAVLHSDGVDRHWSHAPSRFMLHLPPPLLAAAIAHGHRRSHDDATVLALKAYQEAP